MAGQLSRKVVSAVASVALALGLMPLGWAGAYADPADSVSPGQARWSCEITYKDPLCADLDALIRSSAASGMSTQGGAEFRSTAEAGAYVRSQLVARNASISFSYLDDAAITDFDAQSQAIFDSTLDAAYEHTGNGSEGDYLSFQVGGCQSQVSGSVEEGGSVRYEFAVSVGYYSDAAQEAAVSSRLESVYEELALDGLNDYAKASRIYEFIRANTTYDHANLDDDGYALKWTAYAALVNKTAVCQGYANLLYRMLLDNGVDCRIVAGVGGGDRHAWNIAALGGKYYNLDVTWDSERLHSGFADNLYFLKCDANFPDHARDAEFATGAFEARYPMAGEDYNPSSEGPTPDVPTGDFTFAKGADGQLTLVGYTGSSRQVAIPESVDGVAVTAIGNKAFYKNSTVESVTIPKSVTKIEDGWFSYDIDEDEGTYYTTVGAFALCKNLKTVAFQAGSQLREIGEWAFDRCASLSGVALPAGVRVLALSCFEGCSSIEGLVLPEGVVSVEQNALSGTGVKTLHIPATCTSFHEFNDMASLEGITVASGNPAYRAVDGVLYQLFQGKWLTCIYPDCKEDSTYTLPDFVDEAYGSPFLNEHKYLKAIDIGARKFWSEYGYSRLKCDILVSDDNPYYTVKDGIVYDKGCTTLLKVQYSVTGSVIVPDGVTSVGNWSCEECRFSSIVLPESVEAIGQMAFGYNENLKEAVLPKSVSEFGPYMFAGCSALESVELPSGITTLDATFHNCASLKEVVVPSSVTLVANQAFGWCTSLRDLYFLGSPEFDLGDRKDSVFWEVSATIHYPADSTAFSQEMKDRCDRSAGSEYFGTMLTWDPVTYTRQVANRIEPTCEAAGSYDVATSCSGREGVLFTEHVALPALGHDWSEWKVARQATETEDGEEVRTCGNDPSHVESRAIPATGHIHRLVAVPGKAATCEEAGSIGYWRCEGCGGMFSDAQANVEIGPAQTVVPALGHDWGEWKVAKEPACTEPGLRERTCATCGAAQSEEVAAAGHVPGDPRHENEAAATCEQDGSFDLVTRCARCGELLASERVAIPALGHDWGEWEVTAEPTYDQAGARQRACGRCDTVEEEAVAPLEREKVARPAAQSFTFDGEEHAGVPSGEGYTLSGEVSAVGAGSYAAVATLSEGYLWDDGTSEPAEIAWTIAKAANTLEVAKATRKAKGASKKKVVVAGPNVPDRGQGAIAFAKAGADRSAGKFKVNKKTGKITVAKGTVAGAYRVTVSVKAAGDADHEASATLRAVVTVKVKR